MQKEKTRTYNIFIGYFCVMELVINFFIIFQNILNKHEEWVAHFIFII